MEIRDFNIMQIAESGQCFRWNKISDMHYIGVVGQSVCEVWQIGSDVRFKGMSEKEFENYFDLCTDYSGIKAFYGQDEVLKNAIAFGEGVRILNQDKFETLISFIISANNNIPRIKKSVELISKRYGKNISGNYYSFPSAHELSRASEEDLKDCGVGFRNKYIVNTCKSILSGFSLEEVAKLPTDKCKKELMTLMGVGPKVADCVMLFSMGKKDAFPIDVWIKRIMESLYIKKELSLKEIETVAKEKFGLYAGVAQQYLFFYAKSQRENFKTGKILETL